jgi:PilZ domain
MIGMTIATVLPRPDQSTPRFNTDLLVRVFGMDADGRPFSQKSQVKNISDRGAKLCGIEKRLKLGDVIGVQLGDQKARCKVIWATDLTPARNNEVGIRIVDGQPCPWREEREIQQAAAIAPISRIPRAAKDKRKFARQSIPIPIEIRTDVDFSAHLRTNASDITGNGCYIETLRPLPAGTKLNITFSLGSEPIHTTAIVRTSHGGVGMGIEFTGIDDATQKRLQGQVEGMAKGGGLRLSDRRITALKNGA